MKRPFTIFVSAAQKFCCLCLVLFLLPALPLRSLAATEAQDVTRKCRIVMPGGTKARNSITDRMYKTAWVGAKDKKWTIRIELPDGYEGGGLYLCWGNRPESWTLLQNGEPVANSDDNGFAHEYVKIQGGGTLRLVMQAEPKKKIILGELFVFKGDEPPAWVQRWEPTYETADLMVLVAHPDDELLFMGGTIPYYEMVRGKRVVVCYLTCANNMRQSEMLNGLWSMGMRHYPVIGHFLDQSLGTKRKTYALWGKEKVQNYVVELVRKYKPKVLISHDVNGEYGHAAHRVCSELAAYAFDAAAKANVARKSAEQYGTWEVSKLYLHLFKKQPVEMDWSKPYDELGGQTPLQAAEKAFKLHRSQQKNHRMGKNRLYDTTKFGLAATRVGEDKLKNDFFENIVDQTGTSEAESTNQP